MNKSKTNARRALVDPIANLAALVELGDRLEAAARAAKLARAKSARAKSAR